MTSLKRIMTQNLKLTLKSPELACRTVRDLVFKDICYIRDIFQYTNRYAVTPKLRLLYQAYIREKMKNVAVATLQASI